MIDAINDIPEAIHTKVRREIRGEQNSGTWEAWLFDQFPFCWLTTSHTVSGYMKTVSLGTGRQFSANGRTPDEATLLLVFRIIEAREKASV